jgi:hypothetical protein
VERGEIYAFICLNLQPKIPLSVAATGRIVSIIILFGNSAQASRMGKFVGSKTMPHLKQTGGIEFAVENDAG